MTEIREQFDQNGYLILENFCSKEECEKLMQRAEELTKNFELKGQASIFQTSDQTKTSDEYFINSGSEISFFFEKDAFDSEGKLKTDLFHSLNKIGHGVHDLDEVFDHFSRSAKMKKLAEDLGLNEYVIIQSMMIFKHAKIGGVVDVHQDSTFLYTEPDSCIGFWFALEDATIDNGCLWAKPGGHKTTLRTRFARKDGGGTRFIELDDTTLTLDDMKPLEVKQGTCIVLHGLLPHFSKPNTSGKSRQAYSIHTIDKNAFYPKENWLQRDSIELRGWH